MKTILFVVENRDDVRLQYAKQLVHLAWNRWVDGINFWEGQRKTIWFTRREMVKKVLNDPNYKEATHFLFIDTDVIMDLSKGDFIKTLHKGLEQGYDGISGYYCDTDGRPCNRQESGVPLLAPNGIYELPVISMGLSLWKREVWENIEYLQPDPIEKLDADAEFFKEVRKKYKIGTDFSVRGSHLLVAPF